jgi:hypothetical protein
MLTYADVCRHGDASAGQQGLSFRVQDLKLASIGGPKDYESSTQIEIASISLEVGVC